MKNYLCNHFKGGRYIPMMQTKENVPEQKEMDQCVKKLHLANQQLKTKDKEIIALEKKILSQKQLNELIIHTAPVIIMILNKQGCIEMVNTHMEELTGYSLAEIKGKDWFKTFLPVNLQDEIRQFFFKAINNIHTRGNTNSIVTKSGKEIVVSWYDNTIRDSDGNVDGLLCIGQSVSNLNSINEGDAETKAKSDFLRKMGHEIRTPMNAILGVSEILSETITDPLQKNYLTTIRSSVQSLLLLFDHTVKVDEDQYSKERDAIDPNHIEFKKNTRILVVDDISTNRYVLSHYLKRYGFQVLQAENGNTAIDISKAHHPDLIFMDYHMPVLDGYEAAKIIKNEDGLQNIPIVMITASVLQETLDQIEREGLSYIKKPFHKNMIIKELIKHIPYSIKKEQVIHNEKNVKNSFKLNPDVIFNMPEFKKILESHFYHQWENIHEKLYIDDIKQWAIDLKEQALNFSCDPMYDYSKRVLEHIDSFDMVKLQNELKSFSQLFSNS
jgi:PAS domain S-box-containing protein